MNDAVIIAMIAAIPGIAGSVFAYFGAVKAADKTTKSEALKLEVMANKRAREAYEAGIKQLEDQLERMRKQILEERDVSDALRKQVTQLEETVAKMRVQLLKAGIDLAPAEITA